MLGSDLNRNCKILGKSFVRYIFCSSTIYNIICTNIFRRTSSESFARLQKYDKNNENVKWRFSTMFARQKPLVLEAGEIFVGDRRTTRENAFLITAWKFSRISRPLQNLPESVRAGFAVEEKRFCHRQKTFLYSTCTSLVRTLREPQNKQYSFRGPFRPGNFFETAAIFSPLFLRLFIVSPSRRHCRSSDRPTFQSSSEREWRRPEVEGWTSRGREKF